MKPLYESEIRAQLAETLGGALGETPKARSIRLPARDAHASVHPPQNAAPSTLASLDFGCLYGAPLVEQIREVNGWLLFDFSPAFFSALVDEINLALPEPEAADETHAENRMRVLSRHSGAGCPDLPAFHRALLLALMTHESSAAYQRAERAASTLFHKIPARERPALLPQCGALGGALWRLLSASHETAHLFDSQPSEF